MRSFLLSLALFVAFVSVAFAAEDPTAIRRRKAMPPQSAEAQRLRRAQYIHPATAAKRALAYANTPDKRDRLAWWYKRTDGTTCPSPDSPPEPHASMIPPKPCQQSKWFTCSTGVQTCNGYTLASYSLSNANDDTGCCADGFVCKDFGAFSQAFCIIDLDYDSILEKFNEALCDTAEKVTDYFNALLAAEPAPTTAASEPAPTAAAA